MHKDLTGERFGMLVVQGVSHIVDKNYVYYKCLCDCGKSKTIARSNLGPIRSCGCQWRIRKHGHAKAKLASPTYNSWASMHARCRKPVKRAYGYKDITVCERWTKFEFFLEDMGPRPKGRTLDRIDNLNGYFPANCRWATVKQQANNRRKRGTIKSIRCKKLTFNGKTMPVSKWAEYLGLSPYTIYSRLKVNWPIDTTLSKERYPRCKPLL